MAKLEDQLEASGQENRDEASEEVVRAREVLGGAKRVLAPVAEGEGE